ncbi:YoaK family protein [Knoellia sp. Soil729]|uniref:YoaK family protein n=1 Tax=Knoellia sp. Soil729 TaxID=1736394 RepID=UPI0006F8EA44|nr:YoaK family protein [Knoellia sp. Soil729]KRE43414.1 hypothetical protein ASG74_00740 [Knoellia sp. Soil729]
MLLLEAILVLACGGGWPTSPPGHIANTFVVVLCFTMGLQNATITKVSGAQIRTTHVTGMVMDIGIELGTLTYRSRLPGVPPVRPGMGKLGMLAGLVALFFIGGVLGAFGYRTAGFHVLVLAAVALFAVALPPVLGDLRSGTQGVSHGY